MIDPHTAVGIGAANKVSLKESIVVLGTAHPAKFSNVVMKETGKQPELPDKLKKNTRWKRKIYRATQGFRKSKKVYYG